MMIFLPGPKCLKIIALGPVVGGHLTGSSMTFSTVTKSAVLGAIVLGFGSWPHHGGVLQPKVNWSPCESVSSTVQWYNNSSYLMML